MFYVLVVAGRAQVDLNLSLLHLTAMSHTQHAQYQGCVGAATFNVVDYICAVLVIACQNAYHRIRYISPTTAYSAGLSSSTIDMSAKQVPILHTDCLQ